MNIAVTTVSNKSILVVDDDAWMLRALGKVLRDEGIDVIPAFEAAEAMDILTQQQQNIDLVITDLRMPSVSGMTLLYQIHEISPELPVIVLTAFGSPEVRAECLRQGAVAFLEKPVKTQHLLETVTDAFNSQRTGAQPVATAHNKKPGKGGTL